MPTPPPSPSTRACIHTALVRVRSPTHRAPPPPPLHAHSHLPAPPCQPPYLPFSNKASYTIRNYPFCYAAQCSLSAGHYVVVSFAHFIIPPRIDSVSIPASLFNSSRPAIVYSVIFAICFRHSDHSRKDRSFSFRWIYLCEIAIYILRILFDIAYEIILCWERRIRR